MLKKNYGGKFWAMRSTAQNDVSDAVGYFPLGSNNKNVLNNYIYQFKLLNNDYTCPATNP